MVKDKLKLSAVGISTVVLMTASGIAAADNNNGNDNPGNQITICHATGSKTNPFVKVTANANGVVSGHAGHQDENDIIPPFTFNDGGTTKSFAGLNWTVSGQAIFNNNCVQPSGGQGGGGGGNVNNGGNQVGTTTGGAGGGNVSEVTVTPQGAVNAGQGGGTKAYQKAAIAGAGGSLLSLVGGLIWSVRRKLI